MSGCVEESVLLPTVITHVIDHKADKRNKDINCHFYYRNSKYRFTLIIVR